MLTIPFAVSPSYPLSYPALLAPSSPGGQTLWTPLRTSFGLSSANRRHWQEMRMKEKRGMRVFIPDPSLTVLQLPLCLAVTVSEASLLCSYSFYHTTLLQQCYFSSGFNNTFPISPSSLGEMVTASQGC